MKNLLLGAATALVLAAPVQAQDASTVLATVNGTEITLGHLISLRGRLPAEYQQLPDQDLYQALLQQIIQQQAIADAVEPTPADEIGLENETRAFLAGRLLDRLTGEPVDEEAVKSAYEESYGGVAPDMEYNASHILVETEEEAEAVRAEIEDGADFAEIAQEKSTGPSGPNGGQLGWFGPGMMVPAFETAVTELEAGEVSAPIETQFGWHVIKLNETRQQDVPSLDEVRGTLENEIRQQTMQAEVERITGAAEIERTDVEIDPSAIRDDDLLEN